MAMIDDGKVYRYGSGDDAQLTSAPVGATVQLYNGEVALISAGTGATTGYLKNAATPQTTDTVVGMLGEPAGGTYVKIGRGILGGSTDGAVSVNVLTGAFFFQSVSGANALSAASNGKTVYYAGENSTGPTASTSSADGPVLGTQIPQDPGIAGGFTPGPNYWPVVVNPAIGRP